MFKLAIKKWEVPSPTQILDVKIWLENFLLFVMYVYVVCMSNTTLLVFEILPTNCCNINTKLGITLLLKVFKSILRLGQLVLVCQTFFLQPNFCFSVDTGSFLRQSKFSKLQSNCHLRKFYRPLSDLWGNRRVQAWIPSPPPPPPPSSPPSSPSRRAPCWTFHAFGILNMVCITLVVSPSESWITASGLKIRLEPPSSSEGYSGNFPCSSWALSQYSCYQQRMKLGCSLWVFFFCCYQRRTRLAFSLANQFLIWSFIVSVKSGPCRKIFN